MRKLMIILILISHFTMAAFTQPKTDRHLEEIFSKNTDSLFQRVIRDPGTYRLQVIYTRIDRDSEKLAEESRKKLFREAMSRMYPVLFPSVRVARKLFGLGRRPESRA